jgi:hypothetical protein
LDVLGARGGNLLVVGAYLIIAAPDKLYGFTGHRRPEGPIERGIASKNTRADPVRSITASTAP